MNGELLIYQPIYSPISFIIIVYVFVYICLFYLFYEVNNLYNSLPDIWYVWVFLFP